MTSKKKRLLTQFLPMLGNLLSWWRKANRVGEGMGVGGAQPQDKPMPQPPQDKVLAATE